MDGIKVMDSKDNDLNLKIKKFIFKNRKALRGNKTNFSNIEDSLILKMYL